MSSSKEPVEPDQQSYFYVVWPDESKSCPTTGAAPSPAMTCCTTASILPTLSEESAISACTVTTLSESQTASSYAVGSRHSSSSSFSVQSRSPEESPLHVQQQQTLTMASVQNKLSSHRFVEEGSPKITSNGVQAPHQLSMSPSPVPPRGVATTTTYGVPSIGTTAVRHSKTVVLPTDVSTVRVPFIRETENDINLKEIGTLAKQAIAKLQKIVQVSGSGTSLGNRRGDVYGSDVLLPEEPPPSKRPCTMSTSTSARGTCLECEVKNAEIVILRRRLQQLQDELCMSRTSDVSKAHQSPPVEEKLSQVKSAARQIPETIFIGESQHISTTQQPPLQQSLQQPQTIQHQQLQQQQFQHQISQHQNRAILPTPKTTTIIQTEQRQQPQSASTPGKPPLEYVELIPGSDVYISSHKLDEATRDAKTGTQLARKLMDAFWDKDTLARSTLTPRSKFQYQQLDPKVVKTIEAYCLSHDNTLHSKDIHATMTDKCCQARSRYRTVTTSQLLYNPE